MVGMEERLLPHARSIDSGDEEDMAEERRLAYVGITRAKRRLYLVHAYQRSLWGSSELQEVSRFLEEIPTKLLDGESQPAQAPIGGLPACYELVGPRMLSKAAQKAGRVWTLLRRLAEVGEEGPLQVNPADEGRLLAPFPVAESTSSKTGRNGSPVAVGLPHPRQIPNSNASRAWNIPNSALAR